MQEQLSQVSPVCADHLAGPEVGSSPGQQTQGAQVQVTGVAPTERCRTEGGGVRYKWTGAGTGLQVKVQVHRCRNRLRGVGTGDR